MSLNKELIKFTNLENKFENYFKDVANKQILFSGPFGSGKTTFLKNFFENKLEKYEVFYLYPVNYSLHSNSDIFEILKYDIIIELITKDLFEEIDISDLAKYITVISDKIDNAFLTMFSLFSKTGKPLKNVVDLIEKFPSNIKVEINQLSDPLLQVKQFNEVVEKLKNYEYEDYITSLIKNKLETLENKEKVLIVDDLDRIDPDHLFRIISVFSAHIDHETENNKFGFNKIIFVGDVENIRCMFEHKFGMKNSFNAFISKLYSKSPFLFNPEIELYNFIPTLLQKLEIVTSKKQSIDWFNDRSKKTIEYYNYIICFLIFTGQISLREINKKISEPIDYNINSRLDFTNINSEKSDIYILYKIICHLLLNKLAIVDIIDKLIDNKLSVDSVTQGYLRESLIAEYSTIPISILLKIDNQGADLIYNPRELHMDNIVFQVEEFKQASVSTSYRYYGLVKSNANESNLLKLTKSAFKKIQELE
jgi:GTPase SAR1 family protein